MFVRIMLEFMLVVIQLLGAAVVIGGVAVAVAMVVSPFCGESDGPVIPPESDNI